MKKKIFILGLHKSGTSALSKVIINFLYFKIKKERFTPNLNKTYNKYENKYVKETNIKISQNDFSLQKNFKKKKYPYILQNKVGLKLIRENLVLKDPRTIYNIEFWESVNLINKKKVFIAIFRSPNDFLNFYIKSKKKKINKIKKKIISIKFLKKFFLLNIEIILISYLALKNWYLINKKILNLSKNKKLISLIFFNEINIFFSRINIFQPKPRTYQKNIYYFIGFFLNLIMFRNCSFLFNKLIIEKKKYKPYKLINFLKRVNV